MLYSFPDYYNDFVCTGSECPDTCCACWQIVIDDNSLMKYLKYKGKFKKELLKNISYFQKTFKQGENKRCKFLNDKNLCDIQLNMGEKSLCKTCYNYPRHIEEFENVREISLSVSCPAVTDILLSKEDKTTFVEIERSSVETYDNFDELVYSKLCDARSVLINILQNRKYDTAVRMQLAIAFGHDLQVRMNKGEIFSFDEVFERYENKRIYDVAQKRNILFKENVSLTYEYATELFDILFRLEHLQNKWTDYINDVYDVLYQKGEKYYANVNSEFYKWCETEGFSIDVQIEQLLVYFVYTYFCGSIYDEKIYPKVFMSVISVFLIIELIKGKWLILGHVLNMDNVKEIVYKYSRELEHSDINLELFEKCAKPFKR